MSDNDTTMQDASSSSLSNPQNPHIDADGNPIPDLVLAAFNSAQNIRILPGSSDTAASFEFTGEDHTLGNALRYIIMKNPEVEFCGYSIPHPSEPKMNIRIQTYEKENGQKSMTAFEALEKGFDDLADLCDVVSERFAEERGVFGQQQ